MPAVKPDQITIPEHRFACTSCGQCCRNWHVHVTPDEIARLQALQWSPEDAIPDVRTTRIAGSDYVAHVTEGDDDRCIYLDPSDNLCKIHGRYGLEAKPLGCRVYPYTIVSTFPNRYSVTARFDCPAVREGAGESIRKDLPEIRSVMEQMHFGKGFNANTREDLDEKTLHTLVEILFRELLNNKSLAPAERLAVMPLALDRLERMGADFLNNDELDLKDILKATFQRVRTDHGERQVRRLGIIEHWRFMAVLSCYLRRDEKMVGQGLGPRLRRTVSLAGILLARGSARELGPEHPVLPLSARQLFRTPIIRADEIDWRVYLDLFRVRLQAWQFMGPANYNLRFFIGLRALLLTFPMVIAAAKWHALDRDPSRCELTAEDLDYAIGAIDHNFGRSPLLRMRSFAIFTRQMSEPDPYLRLVRHLLYGPAAITRDGSDADDIKL